MAADTAEAKFSINLGGDAKAVSAEMAAEFEKLKQKIVGSNDSVKQMSGALRNLRGTSEEVKSAKEQLKAKIDAERAAISSSTLELLKHGQTNTKVAASSRDVAKSSEGIKNAITQAGGPVAALRDRFENLNKVVGGEGGGFGAATLLAAGALAVLASAATSFISTVAGLSVGFAKWIITAGDAARNLALVREAFAGSAENGARLGSQVDALAMKVPVAKEKLNDMSVQLMRTRLSGEAIVDTMNIVGQASGAMGDEIGNSLKEIVTRGQMYNRFQLNPLELQGTGLQFKDVAKNLASQMGIGVAQAEKALYSGQVKLEDGTRALRKTVEESFGKINAKKLLSLDTMVMKFKETLQNLVKDVDLEPLLKGFQSLADLFGPTTVSGEALKEIFTDVGTALVDAFKVSAPFIQQFMKQIVIGALEIEIAFLTVRNRIQDAFGDSTVSKIQYGKIALDLMNATLKGTAGTIMILGDGLIKVISGFEKLFEMKDRAGAAFDNLLAGLTKGAGGVGVNAAAGRSIAQGVNAGFEKEMGIHSPSKKWEGYGVNTVKGYEIGAAKEAGAGGVLSSLTPDAPKTGTGSRVGGTTTLTVPVTINVHGGGPDAAKGLSAPDFLAQLTRAVEEACKTIGVPTQSTVSP